MTENEYQYDSSGNKYIDHDNVRITFVRRERYGEKDWAGTGMYLRISAYNDDVTDSIRPGPEIPIYNHLHIETLVAKIRAICSDTSKIWRI